MQADIVIIGGGASGIAAAIEAKKTDMRLRVVICERLDRIGKKILSTGNGRCNLSNHSITEKNYHGSVEAVRYMKGWQSADEFFSELGLLCSYDEQGRVYPYSNSAASVLNALRIRLAALGVEVISGFRAVDIKRGQNAYTVTAENGEKVSAKCVIIAAGGYAAPSCGTDGSIIKLMREKGYKGSKIVPAVAPLRTSPDSLKGLKGVRAKCKVSAYSRGKLLREEHGEVQITENSLSGICVFNMAYLLSEHEDGLTLSFDLAPELSSEQLYDYLMNIKKQRPELGADELLTGLFTKNLAIYTVKRALGINMNTPISSIGKDGITAVTKLIKRCDFIITGTSSWQSAQATHGGIHASEIDGRLASRREKGIYFCGEILDTVGDCGGYNLQWAWTSGALAGRNCALSLKGERK